MSMRKAVSKRIKITKKSGMLYRRAGQNHFNAKDSGNKQQRKKKMRRFSNTMEKKMRAYLK